MAVHSLEKKRFEVTKKKVHNELVDYFVNLDEQRKLWYFTLAVNNNARGHNFSLPQAERLIDELVRSYGIRRVNIEAAIAFNPVRSSTTASITGEKQKLIRFRKGSLLGELFEDHINDLYGLIQRKILEFRQALELVLVLLQNYPSAGRAIA